MVDDLQGLDTRPLQESEVKIETGIFDRDLSGPMKNGLAWTMAKMGQSSTQYGDYYHTTHTGVDIRLDTRETRSVPGTTPDRLIATLRDGNKSRKVEGLVKVTETREPMLNLSSYEAAPFYPEKAHIESLNERRSVDLEGRIRVTKEFGIWDKEGKPTVSEGPLRVVVPLAETPIVHGEKINIFVEWGNDGNDGIEVEPNAIVYEKRKLENGRDFWTKTYVEQSVDRNGRRGAIKYPQFDGYTFGTNEVMDLELVDNERQLVDTILAQTGNIEEPPVFNSVFGVEVEKTDPKHLNNKR